MIWLRRACLACCTSMPSGSGAEGLRLCIVRAPSLGQAQGDRPGPNAEFCRNRRSPQIHIFRKRAECGTVSNTELGEVFWASRAPGENSVRVLFSLCMICAAKRTHRACCRTHQMVTGQGYRLEEGKGELLRSSGAFLEVHVCLVLL